MSLYETREPPIGVGAGTATPLDPTVKALGVVSLLNDISSEVTIRTLSLVLGNILGVKTGIIGLIEGLAESAATLFKIVSGCSQIAAAGRRA